MAIRKLSSEQKNTYAAMLVLKKLDLDPKDGGLIFPAVLPPELSPIDNLLSDLAVEGLVELNLKKERWLLTKQGIAYLGELIDEATELVDEFDDQELGDVIAELQVRNVDVLRARFLWGWYDGEFDDLTLFQQRRGITPVERLWAFYLMSDAFWEALGTDIDKIQ